MFKKKQEHFRRLISVYNSVRLPVRAAGGGDGGDDGGGGGGGGGGGCGGGGGRDNVAYSATPACDDVKRELFQVRDH